MFPVLFLQGLNTRGLPMRKKIPANYINIGNDRYVHPKSTNGMKYKYHLLLDKITKLRILKSTPERKKLINKYSKERDLISDEFIKQDCYQLLDEELKDAIVGTLDDLIKKTMKENNKELKKDNFLNLKLYQLKETELTKLKEIKNPSSATLHEIGDKEVELKNLYQWFEETGTLNLINPHRIGISKLKQLPYNDDAKPLILPISKNEFIKIDGLKLSYWGKELVKILFDKKEIKHNDLRDLLFKKELPESYYSNLTKIFKKPYDKNFLKNEITHPSGYWKLINPNKFKE